MCPPKYPLRPLEEVRKKKVDDATRTLGVAIRAREEAAARRRTAEQTRQAHDDDSTEVRESERAALEEGALRAADLVQGEAWEVRVRAERSVLSQAEELAKQMERGARAEELQAGAGVARAKADAEVVEKHRARWQEGERKKAETKEENELVERRTKR